MTDITTRLAELREKAPASVLPAVLEQAGLADHYVTGISPIGPVLVAFSRRGITLVNEAIDPAVFAARYEERFGRPVLPGEPPPRLAAALEGALSHGRTARVPVDLGELTPFQVTVLRRAAAIPPGEVRPYSWLAAEIGRPGSDRAVGSAVAANPVPLIVPCHRVVRADGRWGHYSLGRDANKRVLLAAEGLDVDSYERLSARGVRFLGSSTTRVYCHPSCRHARAITDRRRVEFRDAVAAVAAGYRPCRDCRPRAA